VGEVADYLHVSRSTIHRLLKRNEIPAFSVALFGASLRSKSIIGVPNGKIGLPVP